jgi:hypothetical protein
MTENFPNLIKHTNVHIQEVQWIPSRVNTDPHCHTARKDAECQRQYENLDSNKRKTML